MLVSSRMASIPCSPRHSASNMKDLQNILQSPLISYISPSTTPPLQYFNMRVTERLHRYRSLKRHWHDVSTAVQHESSSPSKSDSPLPILDTTPLTQEQTIEQKVSDVKDYITPTTISMKENNEKNSNEINPLHSRIHQDLIDLRKLIKTREKRHIELALVNPVFDDQETNNATNIGRSSLNKVKLHDRVKVSGCQMRPSTFPQSNSIDRTVINTNNSSNTSSQNSKPQQKIKEKVHSKTFSICRSRIHASLSSDSVMHGTISSKKKPNTPPRITSNTNLKQTQPYRLPMPLVMKKKESSFIKQGTPLPPIRRPSITEQATTCSYNYAASTSSATPRSMKINRNRSLLPILLTSVSCIGTQPQENHDETQENNDDDYYNLLHYKQLINHLPKPIISIRPRYNQDDYGILFEQIDHIRETMPDSHVYDNYTRIC
ncbi:unnamed protein product [Rotaria sp. Silwood2]|nr:unnamed protein product [Rotaria sp. Silwood2]CAF2922365.1 unnamed protein product [Rotaria sp. Silwood2]CAF3296945.1 unnamed protein product [Rotaria sp. Silwood2]CAF3892510.1 unnamed protein product [Rotaria sp. Silwood2]CAF3919545.1 unnamed protein product [Rotaria sp. Silwood2]